MRLIPTIAGTLGGALALGAVMVAAQPAHARVVVGVGIGLPIYAPPPVVYAPPPVYYTAPPVAYAPPPTCQTTQSQAMINGVPATTTTTQCLQPDGTWRVMP
jgi:hypothetical protein